MNSNLLELILLFPTVSGYYKSYKFMDLQLHAITERCVQFGLCKEGGKRRHDIALNNGFITNGNFIISQKDTSYCFSA